MNKVVDISLTLGFELLKPLSFSESLLHAVIKFIFVTLHVANARSCNSNVIDSRCVGSSVKWEYI